MRTLGLDPSLTGYGWAIHDDAAAGRPRRIASGHEETLPSSVPVARFMHLRAMVDRLLAEYRPEAIGIESPAYDAGPFQTIHFGLMMFSLEAVFKWRRDCVLFDPSTLKFLVKGDPKAKRGPMAKLDMQRFVQFDTMDPDIIDNNEADAYCIAFFASRFFRLMNGTLPPGELSPAELRTFMERSRRTKAKVKRTAHAFRENSRYFRFSQVPAGRVDLPRRSDISPDILSYLAAAESQ